MFMIDTHGTRDVATAFISSRTPGDPYWGSCIASPMRSYSRGSTSVASAADTRPGSLRESRSTGSLRPRIGIRTRNPSELIRSASAGRQTSLTECPPNRIFEASNEPYEAPRTRMLYVDMVDSKPPPQVDELHCEASGVGVRVRYTAIPTTEEAFFSFHRAA